MYVNMLSDYLKKVYGHKIYKLLLSGGMSCPNRDGKCGTSGCIFCSEGGAGEFAQSRVLDVNRQIENAISSLTEKERKSGKFIAYFQPYTNTYQSIEYLRRLYMPVVLREDIAVLSIATRPDCISDDVLELLKELNKIKPVWIELGLQTANDKTSEFIKRGYPLSVYTDTAKKLREAKINVITHLILGLPKETKEDMLSSARIAGKYSDGIKFHMLYVQKNTELARLYQDGLFESLSLEDYVNILCDCIRTIPKDTVIHRLTGDCERSSLISPLWSIDKVKVLRELNNALYDKNVIQGEFLKEYNIFE